MPLTYPQFVSLVLGRTGGIESRINARLAEAGAGLTVTPAAAIAYGVIAAGGTVADLTAPGDAGLATIPAGSEFKAVDFAWVRYLQDLQGNFYDVTVSLGTDQSENWSDLGERLQDMVDAALAQLKASYGRTTPLPAVEAAAVVGTITAGTIRVGSRRRSGADG